MTTDKSTTAGPADDQEDGRDDDTCPECGGDSSHTASRYCCMECTKRAAGIDKRIGWKCDLCDYAIQHGDEDELLDHMYDHHADAISGVTDVDREGASLATLWTVVSRVTVPRNQETLPGMG